MSLRTVRSLIPVDMFRHTPTPPCRNLWLYRILGHWRPVLPSLHKFCKTGETRSGYDHVATNAEVFTTCTNPIIHLFYPLPPPPNPPKKKICIGIVFDFSWDIFMSQEKLQTTVMQKSWGVIEAYYGIVQVVKGDKLSLLRAAPLLSYEI